YALTGESYLAPNSLATRFSGSNNLFFGAGAAPAFSTASLNVNPNFTAAASDNFRPLAGSPAIDHGMNTGINRDVVQTLRPSGNAYDIGAYEFSSATTPPPPQQGTLTVNPQTLAFGSVVTGSSSGQNITLSNSSSVAVSISGLTITGTGFSRSAVTLPLVLPPGQTAILTVTFAPQAAGTVSGSLQISSNASNASATVALSGTGTTPTTPPPTQGTLTVSSSSLAFGSVVVGSNSAKTLTLSNTSGASVTVSKIAATGTGFTQTSPALPLTLATGKTATVTVTFAPAAAGSATGNLQITSNATNSAVAVALSGTGTATVQHSVTIAWDAASPAPSGYNVYRGTQSGGPYSTKLNATPISALT
ncbi:MAG TPA: choice-of-anchor D domain-containing protein, partial [Candidatus Angelobacter sp.]|nr:choice-of-anchor D domain-containing protein [Candidatus Angelobacter sp.]